MRTAVLPRSPELRKTDAVAATVFERERRAVRASQLLKAKSAGALGAAKTGAEEEEEVLPRALAKATAPCGPAKTELAAPADQPRREGLRLH